MWEEGLLENDFIYRDAPVPDDLESIFELEPRRLQQRLRLHRRHDAV